MHISRLIRPVCLVALLVIACQSSPVSGANHVAAPTPTTSRGALVVFTTWVPDAKVTFGPEPGYKPALSGLTGHDIQSAVPAIDNSGVGWILIITFTSRGTSLFAKLTHDNVAACPGDPTTGAGSGCPQRHLAIWLDLTQTDIDSWEDPTYAATVSRLYELDCLTAPSSTATCAKLISDPITLQEIDSGHLAMFGGDTEQSATALANAINSTSAAA
jgi:preprotein translocase subunit SecD